MQNNIIVLSLFLIPLFSWREREKNIISIHLFPFFHSIQYLKCFHVAPTWLKLTFTSLPYCVYIGEVQDLGLDLLREVFVLLDPRATSEINFPIHILELHVHMLTKDIFNLFVACGYQMKNNISSKSISARSEQNAPLLYPNRVF